MHARGAVAFDEAVMTEIPEARFPYPWRLNT